MYRQEVVDELVIMFGSVLTDLIVEDGLDESRVKLLLIEAAIHSRVDHPLPDQDAEQLERTARVLKETIETTLEGMG